MLRASSLSLSLSLFSSSRPPPPGISHLPHVAAANILMTAHGQIQLRTDNHVLVTNRNRISLHSIKILRAIRAFCVQTATRGRGKKDSRGVPHQRRTGLTATLVLTRTRVGAGSSSGAERREFSRTQLVDHGATGGRRGRGLGCAPRFGGPLPLALGWAARPLPAAGRTAAAARASSSCPSLRSQMAPEK